MLWVFVEGSIRGDRVLSACRGGIKESIEPSQIQIRRPFLKGISRPPFSFFFSPLQTLPVFYRHFELIYITIKRTTSSSFSNRLSSILFSSSSYHLLRALFLRYRIPRSCVSDIYCVSQALPPYYFLLISSLSMEL